MVEKCKLCNINDATQTNSHIFPWALVKDSINILESKKRDYEVVYEISNLRPPSVEIGRSVLPDYIEGILDLSISDEEQKNQQKKISRDSIFCPLCEARIGRLEGEFIGEVYSKVDTLNFQKLNIDTRGNKKFSLNQYQTRVTHLLAYSIFFRTSIVKFNNQSLKTNFQEKLRKLLHEILSTDIIKMRENIKNVKDHFFYTLHFYFLETTPKYGQNTIGIQHSD